MEQSILEMVVRHVETGKGLIAKQEAIIAEMDRDGHVDAARQARKVLELLRETQRLHDEHLARLRAEAGETTRPA